MNAALRICPFDPSSATSSAQRSAIRDLVVQPSSPWFSEVERRHFEGALNGEFASVAHDRFWIAWNGAEPIAHVYFGTAAGAPETGILAFVITAPAHRGRGIGSQLLREALDDFVAMGGECMQLATANPTARRLYENCGFRDYSGHIMRYLAVPDRWENFDRRYFANVGPAHVRAGHWGDSARITMLYTSSHAWFVRDYLERLYNHPAIPQTRCASILPALMTASGADDAAHAATGGLWVLENTGRRIVGAATLRTLDQPAQAQAPVLDFLLAPGYLRDAPLLLAAAIEAARLQGARIVRACVAECDREKADALRDAGFRHEATLAGQLCAGDDQFDLHVYVLVPDW